jgi:hypothetical protein
MDVIRNSRRDSDRAYPLIALVNLVTAFVALVVCVDGPGLLKEAAQPNGEWPRMLITAGVAGTGALFGAIIGLRHIYLWRSMIICGAAGIVVGLITVAACLSPPPLAPAVVAVLLPATATGIFRSFSD